MNPFRDLGRGVSRSWNRYQLEQSTSRTISLMEAHKKAGLPAGHYFYKALFQDTNKAIRNYCDRYAIPYDTVVVGIPQLRELEALANGSAAGTPIAFYPIAALVMGILLTVYAAGCHDLYAYLTHFVR